MTLLYRSRRAARSLWQEYRIYGDRIELETLLGTVRIPREEIQEVRSYRPPVIRTTFRAFKLDLADLFPHVGITRRSSRWQLRFTPPDPERFVAVARSLQPRGAPPPKS